MEKTVNHQARAIKKLREELVMNQEEFGTAISKSQATVAKYENGTQEPPIKILKLLNKKYGFNFNYYYKNEGPVRLGPTAKPSSVMDIRQMQNNYEMLEFRVYELETLVKKLAADVYSKKHEVES